MESALEPFANRVDQILELVRASDAFLFILRVDSDGRAAMHQATRELTSSMITSVHNALAMCDGAVGTAQSIRAKMGEITAIMDRWLEHPDDTPSGVVSHE